MNEIENKVLSFLEEKGPTNGFRLRIEIEKLGHDKKGVREALNGLIRNRSIEFTEKFEYQKIRTEHPDL